MSRRTFASIAAFVSVVNAIPGLIAPAAVASPRGFSDPAVLRGLDVGNLVAWAVSAVVWTYAVSSGLASASAWFGVGLMVLFTVGWAYFVFADSRTGSRAITATAPR